MIDAEMYIPSFLEVFFPEKAGIRWEGQATGIRLHEPRWGVPLFRLNPLYASFYGVMRALYEKGHSAEDVAIELRRRGVDATTGGDVSMLLRCMGVHLRPNPARTERNNDVWLSRLNGESFSSIAKRHQISTGRARQIFSRRQDAEAVMAA